MALIRSVSGSGSSGSDTRALVKKGYIQSGNITASNLTVGKEYILVLCTNSSSDYYAEHEVTITSTSNCTYQALVNPSVQDISRYEGYSAYKIIPTSTSVSITLDIVTTIYMLFE